jgi:hypothetical protein
MTETAPDIEHKNFRCYELLDSGEKTEIEVTLETIRTILHPENVLLLVRFDLRRLFIWKGPRAPVRQRFISSREGSKVQEEAAKKGVHLKIISVDAGDEPEEFLMGFNITSFEVKDEDRPEELRYIRNDERKKLEEAAAAAEKQKASQKKDEYWSPLLEEQKKAQKAQVNSPSVNSSSPVPITSNPSPRPSASDTKPMMTQSSRSQPVSAPPANLGLNEAEEKSILNSMIKLPAPDGFKRLNIVIGTSLYGPQKVVAKVFGKEVESEEWAKIPEIPEGRIDIEAGMLRVFVQGNKINGIEVFNKNTGEEAKIVHTEEKKVKEEIKTTKEKSSEKVEEKSSEKETASQDKTTESSAAGTKGKRQLKPIPRGE